MKCKACDEILTDYEATRKVLETNEYLELCNNCFDSESDGVLTLDRADLKHVTDEKPGLEFEQLDEYDYKNFGINDIYYDQ
jgi:type IV secretory pathway VirD2 relaxase